VLYAFPDLDLEDSVVLEEIAAMRAELAEHLRVPRRWTGRLRRTALARAIRGSNSIEGYRIVRKWARKNNFQGDDILLQRDPQIEGYEVVPIDESPHGAIDPPVAA
jgi:hypothetical protein